MSQLEEVLASRLTTFAALTALVGPRIYPVVLPQTPTYPCVTYQRISTTRESAMGVEVGIAHARVQCSAWAQTYTAAKGVKEQLRAALERWRGTVLGVVVQDSFFLNELDLYEADVRIWHLPVDFMIHYAET